MKTSRELAGHLKEHLMGQDAPLEKLAEAYILAHQNHRPNRSRMLALLLGPTGTGKTESTILVANNIFGSNIENLAMAEYMSKDSVEKLLGAHGRCGLLGKSIDRLNEKGGGILLLDEIEKAHSDISKVLLSFDSGRVTMADGETRSLEDICVILTSNLGAAEAAKMVSSTSVKREHVMRKQAERHFSPEILARFTDIIAYDLLSFEAQEHIAKHILRAELKKQESSTGRYLQIDEKRSISLALRLGYTERLGARILRNTIEKLIARALENFRSLDDNSTVYGSALFIEVVDDNLIATPLRDYDSRKAHTTQAA